MTAATVQSKAGEAPAPRLSPTGDFEIVIASKRGPDGALVIDHDGDVYADGAVGQQKVEISCWNHSGACTAPAGSALTFETPLDIRARGRLDLATDAGRDEFKVWRALGDRARFSYRYQPIDFGFMEVHGRRVRELRRVLIGAVDLVQNAAGLGTRVVSLKAGCSCGCSSGAPVKQADLHPSGAEHVRTCELCRSVQMSFANRWRWG